jgi:nucleolar GTP-binding protein
LKQKLDELEAEEDKLIEAGFYDVKMEENNDESRDLKKLAKRIRTTRKLGIMESRFNKTQARRPALSRPDKKVPRSRLEKTMTEMGLDMTDKDDVKRIL